MTRFVALLKQADNILSREYLYNSVPQQNQNFLCPLFLFCSDTTPLQFPRKKRVTKGYHETSSVNDAAEGSKAPNN